MPPSAAIYTSTGSAAPSAEREPLTFTLFGSKHRNLVVYGPDSEPLYHVETRRHPHRESKNERTLIFRQDEGDQIYLIACLDFHDLGDWREDTIIFEDKHFPLACYLPRSGTHCRRMSTPSGQWTWTKSFGGGLKLQTASKSHMAKYQRKFFRLRSAKRTIEIDEEALPYLDAIIIGWIVVSRDIQLERISGSGGGGVLPVG